MAKASKEILGNLQQILDEAADGPAKVTGKKMFGCHALWAGDAVFGLVWKEGRIRVSVVSRPARRSPAASAEGPSASPSRTPWWSGTRSSLSKSGVHSDYGICR